MAEPIVQMTPDTYFRDWTRFAWKFGITVALVGSVILGGLLYAVVTRPIVSAIEGCR